MSKERLFLSPPDMSGRELKYVEQAFESNYIAPLGPMVDEFERAFSAYTGIPHCLALSSGTGAMHLAIRELLQRTGDRGRKTEDGVQRTAERKPLVLASTLTFIGSVSPATFEHCDITFIDCDRESWNMDVALLEEELEACKKRGRLPLAVIPTDLYGQCCDLLRIISVCDKYQVPVVCDSAEAMGARYRTTDDRGQKTEDRGQGDWKHAGYDAWASVYSFNGNKIITTSGGGMLASHDKDLIDHARKLATQARDDVPHYEHSEIGYNYRMSNIVAAIGVGQIEVLDKRVERKREIFAAYQALLGEISGITFMPEAPCSRHNRWLTVILIDERICGTTPSAVRLALEADNIEARPLWKPMHLQPVFEQGGAYSVDNELRTVGGTVAQDLFSNGLCLPSGTAMTDQDIERVAGLIKKETA